MFNRFQYRTTLRGRRPPPAPHPAAQGLGRLLESLRERQVTVVAGGESVTGRLISTDPVRLVRSNGVVSVIPLSRVQAVSY